MQYVVAIVIAIIGLVIIRDTLLFAKIYGLAHVDLDWLLTVLLGIFLVSLAWYIFKQTIEKTYTIRKG
jgi:hypothetical protein